jgi:hypothetical protein
MRIRLPFGLPRTTRSWFFADVGAVAYFDDGAVGVFDGVLLALFRIGVATAKVPHVIAHHGADVGLAVLFNGVADGLHPPQSALRVSAIGPDLSKHGPGRGGWATEHLDLLGSDRQRGLTGSVRAALV